MTVVFVLLLAYIVDLLIGDPRFLPHPVIGIARLATLFEKIFRRMFRSNLFIAGGVTVLLTLGLTVLVTVTILKTVFLISLVAGYITAAVLLYFCLATKSLIQHSKAVYSALVPVEDIALARQKVAMIVGRETNDLSAEKVIKAAVESVAENFVDGIAAPLLWGVTFSFFSNSATDAAIMTATGAMVYKSINTMDSMFGYKNEKYRKFGWAAAKLDDIANFFPARISGIIILFAALLSGKDCIKGMQVFNRDRLKHLSPNAGHSEAAVAGVLGLQFGGPAVYHGILVDKPFIGDGGNDFTPQVILETNRLILITSAVTIILLLIIELSVWGITR